jgi:hypothetical protein
MPVCKVAPPGTSPRLIRPPLSRRQSVEMGVVVKLDHYQNGEKPRRSKSASQRTIWKVSLAGNNILDWHRPPKDEILQIRRLRRVYGNDAQDSQSEGREA